MFTSTVLDNVGKLRPINFEEAEDEESEEECLIWCW